jgi:bifunctional enzyme CysN/CysC
MNVARALSPTEAHREQMSIVIVGHVDHGKSTVVGRLLADTGSLPQGKLDAVRRECLRTGKPFEYAFLLDALADEQDQGITIDAARCFFKTARRDYIIIDAPGHIEFLKNMISGAARAEAAVLVIDAKDGVRENSRRHGYLLAMLGIQQIIVCVNKMDLVADDREHFLRIEREYRAFLDSLGGVRPSRFIPVSAIRGDNLLAGAPTMSWYDGPTLLAALDAFAKEPARTAKPLRMPVQAVYKFTEASDDRRIVAGRVESGRVEVGQRVVFSPSGKRATIRTVEGFNTGSRSAVLAGESTGFTLDEEIYVTRGEVMSLTDKPPPVSNRFRAHVIWLGKEPFRIGRDYKLKIHTATVPVRIASIERVIDAAEANTVLAKDHLSRHDVADLILETRHPIAFDPSTDVEATGRFVVVEGYDVAGGGIIVQALQHRRDSDVDPVRLRLAPWAASGVTGEARARRFGHRPALLLFTGRTGTDKQRHARAIEAALFEVGHNAQLLVTDGLQPLQPQLAWAESPQDEPGYHFAAAARLLLRGGALVVSTSDTIGSADLRSMAAELQEFSRVVVDVDPDGTSADPCDLRISGREPTQELLDRVMRVLEARQICRAQ